MPLTHMITIKGQLVFVGKWRLTQSVGENMKKKIKKKINQPPHPDDHTMATTSAYFNQHSRLKIKDNEFRNKQKQQNKTKTHIGATS